MPHRRYPLPEIQKWYPGERLFETAFNYVHFHVVDGVLETGQVQVLDFKKVEETSFTLCAQFSLTLGSSRVALELEYDATALPKTQADAIADCYARVLKAMAADPYSRFEDQSDLSAEERHIIL